MLGVDPQTWRLAARGLELGLLIGGMGYGGYWLDQRWGTDPYLALSGVLLAMIGGCYNLAKDAGALPWSPPPPPPPPTPPPTTKRPPRRPS